MHTYLGIDGGGTHTRALLCDATGRILGRGQAGVANHLHAGWDGATAAVRTAVAQAWHEAGTAPRPNNGIFLGMAGAGSEDTRQHWRQIAAQEHWVENPALLCVDHDIRIALAGGLAGAPGIALIAGTGSACYGRSASGTTWQAGGWGSILDDGGGGYWLGLRAIGAAVRAADHRGPTTALSAAILTRLQVSDLRQIVTQLHSHTLQRHQVAVLAEEVFRTARNGDPAARAILAQGASELATMVRAVAHELFPQDTATALIFSGSVATAPDYAPLITAELQRTVPQAQICPAKLNALAGAALLALESAGIPITDSVVKRLSSTHQQNEASAG